jgi:hypothetical protein
MHMHQMQRWRYLAVRRKQDPPSGRAGLHQRYIEIRSILRVARNILCSKYQVFGLEPLSIAPR